jgi:hypothetical protein
MNILKPLAIAAISIATLTTAAHASPKMPAELVGKQIGGDGEVTADGISYEDTFCTPLSISKKFDRSIPAATKTPLGVWVYTITFNCKDESGSDIPDERVVYRMYVSKGSLFMEGKSQ